MAISTKEVRKTIAQIREMLESLEAQLGNGESEPNVDPYVRRRQILQRIYWNDNSMLRDELMPLLHDFGTNYAWIGQQVRKGYLQVSPTPSGSTRYTVTDKAIRDEGLARESQEADAISELSTEAFAEDWNSEEDAAYDSL